jgi:hypothetical protein
MCKEHVILKNWNEGRVCERNGRLATVIVNSPEDFVEVAHH